MKRFGAAVVSVILGLCAAVFISGCQSETYTPPAMTPKISTPDIHQEGILRVGVNADNNSPFAGKPGDTIVGLDVDIAAALADELGLKLDIVDIGTDPDKALEDGTVDIVVGIDKSDTAISCWSSEAYIQSGVALFATSSSATIPTSDSSPRIAAQSSSMSAWEVNRQFGEEALVSSPELKPAFSDLASGSVTYVASDAVIGTYAAYTSSPQVNASIIALMQKPTGYGVGVLDTNAKLKQVISDTLVTLTGNGMIQLIESKWLGKPLDLTSVPFTEAVTAQEVAEANPDETTGGEVIPAEGEGDTGDTADEGTADTAAPDDGSSGDNADDGVDEA